MNDSRSSSPHPVRKAYSEEVSAKALKNILVPSQQSDHSERRKLKQDVFLEGKFEDICELISFSLAQFRLSAQEALLSFPEDGNLFDSSGGDYLQMTFPKSEFY